MPLPLNQKTKRLSIGLAAPSAAYAVPWELNMLTSGGNPMRIALPASVIPFKKRLRDTLGRLVMICDTGLPSCHSHHHIPEPEPRLPKLLEDLANEGTVCGCFHTSVDIAEVLLDDAFLALRTGRQDGAQVLGRCECGVRQAGHLAFGVEVQLHGADLALGVFAFAHLLAESELEAVATLSDGIELLEAEADGVDQVVAAGAGGIGGVGGEAIAIGYRLGLGDGRQVGVDAGRRIGHVLAEELFAHEEAAGGG